jgi:hypothetical protein
MLRWILKTPIFQRHNNFEVKFNFENNRRETIITIVGFVLFTDACLAAVEETTT